MGNCFLYKRGGSSGGGSLDAFTKTVMGKFITLTDSAAKPFKGLRVFGRTEQKTTTGKNLLPNTATTRTSNGITFTINDDGSVTMNGTATERAFLTVNSTLQLEQEERYTLNGCPDHAGLRFFAGEYGSDAGTGFTFTAYTTVIAGLSPICYIRVESGTVLNNVIVRPMLRLASIVDDTYEPYTGGIPSPNPDYPQELNSVGDSGAVNVTVCGKNLLDESKLTANNSSNPIYTEIVGGRIHFVNTSGTWYVPSTTFILPPGTYYFGYDLETISGEPFIGYNANGTTIWGRGFFTLTEVSTVSVRLTTTNTNSVGEYYANIWVTAGNVVTAYEPYKEIQTLPISTPNGLPGIPVTSGGNYTDENGQQWICDEVDFEKGVYVQRVDRFVFTGNENIGHAGAAGTVGFYCFVVRDIRGNGYGFATCNYFQSHSSVIQLPAGNNTEQINKVSGGSGTAFPRMCFSNDILGVTSANTPDSAIAAVRSWLKARNNEGNPLVIISGLETPIETPLSAEQLAAYAALHTNLPNTIIYNDAGAGMEVKYTSIGG